MLLKIGCCGFPVGRRQYAAPLAVVEVQQTFYQPPQLKTVARWRQEAPPGFEFTLKAWQLITHEATSPTYRRLKRPLTPAERRQAGSFKDTAVVRRAWEVTQEMALALKARLILFQCPASFGPEEENRQRLRRFFQNLDRGDLLLAWEPRGPWPRQEVADLCRELDLLPVVDPFSSPPFAGPLAYWRLHGKGGYRYTYTDDDLQALKTMVAGHQEVYLLFNNQSMWADACQCLEIMGKAVGK